MRRNNVVVRILKKLFVIKGDGYYYDELDNELDLHEIDFIMDTVDVIFVSYDHFLSNHHDSNVVCVEKGELFSEIQKLLLRNWLFLKSIFRGVLIMERCL